MKRVCYLCQKKTAVPFRRTKKRQLLHCLSCDLIWVEGNRISNIKNIEGEEKFLKEYLTQRDLFSDYFKQKFEILEKQKRGRSILDIGCSSGLFLKLAQEKNWEVLGIDPSAKAAEYAQKQGLNVRKASFEKVKVNPMKFDVVTIFQTIEHMQDPIGVFKKIKKLMKPNAILMLTTPNRESLLGNLSGKRWFGYYNEEHLFFFNKKSLRDALKKAGFRNIEIKEEWGRVLTPSWVLTRLSGYYYNHKSVARKTITSFRSFWDYFDWLKFKEPQANLLVLAKKEE